MLFRSGEYEEAIVLETESPVREGFYLINNGLLRVTSEHPIYIKKQNGIKGWGAFDAELSKKDTGFEKVLEITKGDKVFTKQWGWEEIEKIEYIKSRIKTYNLKEVTGNRTFFADEVLVHNKSGRGGGSGGSTGNSGIGGGGPPSRADVDVYSTPGEQPLASVYLSQVPYTGIDFGDFQTIFFILGLLIWSFIIAHIFVNKGLLDYFIRKIKENSIFIFWRRQFEAFKNYKPSPVLVATDSVYKDAPVFSGEENVMDSTLERISENEIDSYEEEIEFETESESSFVGKGKEVSPEEKFLTALSANDYSKALFVLNRIKSDKEARSFAVSVIDILDSEYRKRIGAGGKTLKPKFVKTLSEVENTDIEKMIETLTYVLDGVYSSALIPLKVAVIKFFEERESRGNPNDNTDILQRLSENGLTA